MSTTFKKIWRIPFWLGILTLFGLLIAILGTGFWYGIAWVAVSLPLLVIVYYINKARFK